MTRIMPFRARPTIKMAVAPGAGAAAASADDAEESATESAASAAAALVSQTASAASAAAALVSETNAETAETNAETAQAAAEAAQAAAEAAQTAAETAETNAETAETNAETAETNAETAQAAAETARDLAQNYAAALRGTSTTSLSIGTGSKVFTTQASKQWALGERLRAASDDGVKIMEGEVTDYTGTALTLDVDYVEDSGTHADWNISITGARGSEGAPGSMSGPVSAVVGNFAAFDDISGTSVDDSGYAPDDFATAAQGTLAGTAVQPARQVISGAGLTGGGDLSADRTLAVGAGTGIVVNADDVAVDIGKQTIWVPASAMIGRTTNGAVVGSVEATTNKNMWKTLDFDSATQEFAQFTVAFPKSWNEGTVTFVPYWSHPSTTTNFGVVFGLAGVAMSDSDPWDVAFGTAQTSTDTGGTTDDVFVGPESAAITIAGTPAVGDIVQFQINRTVADGSDTMAVDARLIGVKVLFTINALKDD
jgi:hypothetical protein